MNIKKLITGIIMFPFGIWSAYLFIISFILLVTTIATENAVMASYISSAIMTLVTMFVSGTLLYYFYKWTLKQLYDKVVSHGKTEIHKIA